ncbi:MAG: 30S ribosome-binding factor RbfA [Patescibacteria group bacterium]|nr:30S ribosome-binding factor RbfA [Patescibacteria group bacterium]
MANRTEKLNEAIKHALGSLIAKEVEFPENLLVTVTKVDVSPDGKYAKAYVTVLPDNMRGTALKIMNSSAGMFRSGLAKNLKTKFTPKLSFLIDEQEIYANKIEELLDEVRNK